MAGKTTNMKLPLPEGLRKKLDEEAHRRIGTSRTSLILQILAKEVGYTPSTEEAGK